MTAAARSRILSTVFFLVSLTAQAQISVDLRPVAPGSDELLLEWAADPSLTGPFHLLRGRVDEGRRVAEALPLDPLLDRWTADVSSPRVLSRTLDGPAWPGTVFFQVVSEDGGCSNLAYVVKHQPRAVDPDGERYPLLIVSLPWRGGVRTFRGLMDDQPQVVGAATASGGPESPAVRTGRRVGVDGFSGDDRFVPQGAGLFLLLDRDDPLVLMGAAEASPRGVFAGGRGWNSPFTLVSLPFGTSYRRKVEILCGLEGVDWTPRDWTGLPDDCPNGWFDPESGVSMTASHWDRGGGYTGMSAFDGSSRVRFIGTNSDIDPSLGYLENQNTGARFPSLWLPPEEGTAPACRCADSDGDGTDDCTEALLGTDPVDPDSRGPDHDRDGAPDDLDVCPGLFDPAQDDTDGDGFGDACDACPDGDPACEDPDGDGVLWPFDSCPLVADAGGGPFGDDADGDFIGDACDPCPEILDLVLPVPDRDADGRGDACDCAPDENSAWGPALAQADLRVSHAELGPGFDPTGLIWTERRNELGSGTRYDLVRGEMAGLWASGMSASASCHRSELADAQFLDFDEGSSWYSVRTRNACGAGPWAALGRYGRPLSPSPLDDDDPCP